MKVVLMYHDVYHHDHTESGFCRERDRLYKLDSLKFEDQVKCITEYLNTNNLPKDTIVFSFDDGGKSFYTVIAPILEKYGYNGLFFISTKFIGADTFLSASQIRELNDRGHIIGSHAHTHEHLYTLSEAQVYQEWETSTRVLREIINRPIEYASIPNGDVSDRGIQIMNKLGIKYIYTSIPTTKISEYINSELIGRYVVLADSTTEKVLKIVSNKLVRRSILIKYYTISIIKQLLGSHYIQIKNALFRR